MVTVAIILGIGVVVAAGMLTLVSHRKKSRTGYMKLLGSTGLVVTKLDPCGTVLVRGELWRACSYDVEALATSTLVEVVGTRDHLLLVRLQHQ